MKRFSIILLGALAILMAGCSKDVPVSPPDENAWINDINLPVPIQFGHSSLTAVTKADDPGMIEEDVLNQRTVGVIGIDAELTWKGSSASSFNKNALLLKEDVMTTENGDIVFTPKKYYPMLSEQNYDFYGYYPHDIDNLIRLGSRDELPGSTDGNQILFVKYENIGYKDILWGSSKAKTFTYMNNSGVETEVTGYNAKYIRKVKQAEQELLNGRDESSLSTEEREQLNNIRNYFPSIKFKHCLSAVRFNIQAKDETAEKSFVDTYDDPTGGKKTFETLKITGLTIKNLYQTGSLIVAIRENEEIGVEAYSEWEGRVVPFPGIKPSDHILTNADGSKLTPVTPRMAIEELGQGLMLIPGSAELDYGAKLEGILYYSTFAYDDANQKMVEVKEEMEIELPLIASENFKAGKRYTFTIVLNSLEMVEIKTSLQPWDDSYSGESVDGANGEGGEKIEIE